MALPLTAASKVSIERVIISQKLVGHIRRHSLMFQGSEEIPFWSYGDSLLSQRFYNVLANTDLTDLYYGFQNLNIN